MTKFGQTDPYAYYDSHGNRYLFLDHREFLHYISQRMVEILLKGRNIE